MFSLSCADISQVMPTSSSTRWGAVLRLQKCAMRPQVLLGSTTLTRMLPGCRSAHSQLFGQVGRRSAHSQLFFQVGAQHYQSHALAWQEVGNLVRIQVCTQPAGPHLGLGPADLQRCVGGTGFCA